MGDKKIVRGASENCHTEDNSPNYRRVCNDVGLESPTHRSFKFWYRDFCSSLRANAKQSRETVITRSDKRRSNRIHIEKDAIGATHVDRSDNIGSYFINWCRVSRCTPLAMTEKRLRNKCAMTYDLFPRPFGERVRERGYLAASLLSRLAAFTLAEVLITLGIIGVVAAMTMPALIQNYRKSVVENKLKSEYSLISNAIRMSEAKNGSSEDWATCDEDNSFECTKSFFDTYLAPELKTVKICGNDNKEECWTEPVSLSGKKGYLSPLIDNKGLTAILSNGTSLYMWAGGQNSEAAHLQIWFDIDGPTKGKGIIGADVFGTITFFKAREEIRAGTFMQGCAKLLDVDNYKNDTEYGCSKDVDTPWAGFYCGALIQQNGWKIPKDYPVRL